jgi:hypothetical protein
MADMTEQISHLDNLPDQCTLTMCHKITDDTLSVGVFILRPRDKFRSKEDCAQIARNRAVTKPVLVMKLRADDTLQSVCNAAQRAVLKYFQKKTRRPT